MPISGCGSCRLSVNLPVCPNDLAIYRLCGKVDKAEEQNTSKVNLAPYNVVRIFWGLPQSP